MTITEIRKMLEDTLSANDIRVLPAGAVNPPSVFIVPGPAWLMPSKLGSSIRLFNWSIMGVVGVPSEVAIVDQEALAEKIDEACRELPRGWTLPNFEAPGYITLSGLQYLAFRAAVQFQG